MLHNNVENNCKILTMFVLLKDEKKACEVFEDMGSIIYIGV